MKGLLLAGGHGTRLRPLTLTGNKHMLPIANKPMILYGLEHLRDAGIKEIAIILGPIREGIVDMVGDGSSLGVRVKYIEQPEPKGLAHAVMLAEHFIGDESFAMYLGDNLLRNGIKYLVDEFQKHNADALVALARVKDPTRYGVAELKNGKIVRLVEKPKEPPSDLALVGVYLFTKPIFEAVKSLKPSWRGELEITEAIQKLVDSGLRVKPCTVSGWWKDTGKPEDLLEANQLVLSDLEPINEGMIEEGARITGSISIGKDTIIRKGSNLRGPIIIGRNCEIGPGAYIGPYTSIGNNVFVRNGEVENSIIMDGSTIECNRRIVDSLIGRSARIGSSETKPEGFKFIVGDNAYVQID